MTNEQLIEKYDVLLPLLGRVFPELQLPELLDMLKGLIEDCEEGVLNEHELSRSFIFIETRQGYDYWYDLAEANGEFHEEWYEDLIDELEVLK